MLWSMVSKLEIYKSERWRVTVERKWNACSRASWCAR